MTLKTIHQWSSKNQQEEKKWTSNKEMATNWTCLNRKVGEKKISNYSKISVIWQDWGMPGTGYVKIQDI